MTFFTPPNIIICLILFIFTFNGFRNGFIEEISKILSLIGGLIIASKFHHSFIPYFENYIISHNIQVIVSYMCIFLSSMILIKIISKIIQRFIEFALLGWLNRLLGLLLGLLKGFIVISLFIFISQLIPIALGNNNYIKNKLENESIMYQICTHVQDMVILTLPTNNNLDILDKKMLESLDENNIQKILNDL